MKLLENLKRIGIDVGALITVVLLMIFVPEDFLPIAAKANLVSLFFTKFILVSAAIIHAHITRKLLFPYINFETEKDLTNNLMVIAWYVIVIFGWTRGG
jgi:Ni/Fe-hydrogenase subunit HybB-like protein